ncbi:hypothetical protein ACWJJH_18100 [Endozoicomonadaceae bacterium StTr2]
MQHAPRTDAGSGPGPDTDGTSTELTKTTTEESSNMVAEHHDDSDSRLDAFAATALILIAVFTALFWVAGQ